MVTTRCLLRHAPTIGLSRKREPRRRNHHGVDGDHQQRSRTAIAPTTRNCRSGRVRRTPPERRLRPGRRCGRRNATPHGPSPGHHLPPSGASPPRRRRTTAASSPHRSVGPSSDSVVYRSGSVPPPQSTGRTRNGESGNDEDRAAPRELRIVGNQPHPPPGNDAERTSPERAEHDGRHRPQPGSEGDLSCRTER